MAAETMPETHYQPQGAAPVVPFDRAVWSAEDCAAYLKQEKSTFLKRTQYAKGFPPRLDIPGQPRWRAILVTEWAIGKEEAA